MELVGLNSERKRLIEYLQRCGTVDISDSRCGILDGRETAQTISNIESNMSQLSSAISILPKEKSGLFAKRTEVSGADCDIKNGEAARVMDKAYDILQIKKETDKNKDELSALELEEDSLVGLVSLDVPANLKSTSKTAIRLGVLEGERTEEEIWEKLGEHELSAVYFEIIGSSRRQTVIWMMYLKAEERKMSEFCLDTGFAAPKNLPGAEPSKRLEEIRLKKQKIEKDNEELKKRISEYGKDIDELELFYDKISVRRDKYRALENIGITKNAFFVSGYLPESECDRLYSELTEKFTVSVEFFEPDKSEDVPKAFSNNAFVAPVEGITSDYSMPSGGDVDPNPIMAVFYYFFFGMMFSDAGYGLLLMIVCGILGFSGMLEKGKRNMFRMFFYCGVSTTFWGLMYGSFFGDLIATVSNTFGSGKLALSPILVDPVKKPLMVLIMSVIFGTIHILTAMAIKFYMTWRDGKRWSAIFDSGFWMLVIIGIGILAAGAAFGIKPLAETGKYMAIGAAAGLVLTQGRSSKNPVMKLFNGILSLYDITSIVGDVLSYSRLMALGLATGVIASVVNVLGSLGGNSVVGIICFIAISIFGHSLNFAINMLGAYVHTNRLQYVEFYQKFYEGGGRKYKPLGLNTKDYKFD